MTKTITIKQPRRTYKISVNKTYKIYRGNTCLGVLAAPDWLKADGKAQRIFKDRMLHVQESRWV